MENCIIALTTSDKKRDKILTGFNFYGYDYSADGGRTIVAKEYLKLLKDFKGRELRYDAQAVEHFFEVK